jgi:hypothetical protein
MVRGQLMRRTEPTRAIRMYTRYPDFIGYPRRRAPSALSTPSTRPSPAEHVSWTWKSRPSDYTQIKHPMSKPPHPRTAQKELTADTFAIARDLPA